ncbi:hypothetical protein [Photobacterium aquae]|nr:hypothetical protein [Photobacterium aquae]
MPNKASDQRAGYGLMGRSSDELDCNHFQKTVEIPPRENAIIIIDNKLNLTIMQSSLILWHFFMAITIRNIEEHYYMIESLKELTNSSVTTKALIKGGYLAVELGQALEDEKAKRQKAEDELNALKETIKSYINSKNALQHALTADLSKTKSS